MNFCFSCRCCCFLYMLVSLPLPAINVCICYTLRRMDRSSSSQPTRALHVLRYKSWSPDSIVRFRANTLVLHTKTLTQSPRFCTSNQCFCTESPSFCTPNPFFCTLIPCLSSPTRCFELKKPAFVLHTLSLSCTKWYRNNVLHSSITLIYNHYNFAPWWCKPFIFILSKFDDNMHFLERVYFLCLKVWRIWN